MNNDIKQYSKKIKLFDIKQHIVYNIQQQQHKLYDIKKVNTLQELARRVINLNKKCLNRMNKILPQQLIKYVNNNWWIDTLYCYETLLNNETLLSYNDDNYLRK